LDGIDALKLGGGLFGGDARAEEIGVAERREPGKSGGFDEGFSYV
jgi:hypothetical protein